MEILSETTPLEALNKLVEEAKVQRLAPADEERASALLRELLHGGRQGIVAALEPMLALPWIVGVNAVAPLWAELTAPKRRYILTGLASAPGEQARRLHLSLARALFKTDPAAGLKVAAAAAAELAEPETGVIPQKNRYVFFHVFIGKGKPWLLQLPLGDLKGSEADALVHATIETLPLCPPLSQLSLLRWINGAGRFKKLSEADVQAVAKAVSRWNVKLQRLLKEAFTELPEELLAVMKPEVLQPRGGTEAAAGDRTRRREPSSEAGEAEPEEDLADAPEGATSEGQAAAAEVGDNLDADAEEDDDDDADNDEADEDPVAESAPAPEELVIPSREQRRAQKERAEQPPRTREPRGASSRSSSRDERREPTRGSRNERHPEHATSREREEQKPFDVKDALRGLEAYVTGLRNELEQTKAQLRRREEESRRGARQPRGVEEVGNVDVEAVVRHNHQLESTVHELRHQLEDLAAHHESVAESRLLHTDDPLPEGSAAQLRALLHIKLSESFETYQAMRAEPLDKVFRLDYRDLLGSVFDVLHREGVPFKS